MTAAPIYTVEIEKGWSYIVGSNGYREGPIRYQWEAQEWADEMNATGRIANSDVLTPNMFSFPRKL